MSKKIICLLKITISLSFICLFSFFKNDSVNAEGIGFEIRPILPSTQIDKTLGYYYIQTKPGINQSFDVSILNTGDKDITLDIFTENAISTNNGDIVYSDDLEKIHESLEYPISEIVKPKDKEIIVKKGEEIPISFEITPPETSYNGLKMGRLIVKEKVDKEGKGIKQEYQYGIGIILSESGESFNNGDALELSTVKPNIYSGKKVIEAELINPDSKTIENLKVRSYVTKKGDSKKIKERNVDNFSFAPNSKANYMIPWGLSNFVTGEYTFHFIADNGFENFKFEQDFVIRANDAKNLNNEAAFSVGTPKIMKTIIIILNGILILLSFLILIRNKKWLNKLKSKKRKKNRKK